MHIGANRLAGILLGPYLKHADRHIYPPADLWKELVCAPAGFKDETTLFSDAMGLPKNVNLYTPADQPIVQYRVQASTDVNGSSYPTQFSLVQYRPARIPNSNRFSTNAWELQLTAEGTVTSIHAAKGLKLPQRLLRLTNN